MKGLTACLSAGVISVGTALLPFSSGYALAGEGRSTEMLIAQSRPYICTIQRYSQDGQYDLYAKPTQAQRSSPNGFLPLWGDLARTRLVNQLPVGITVRVRRTGLSFSNGLAAVYGETYLRDGSVIRGYMAATYMGECYAE